MGQLIRQIKKKNGLIRRFAEEEDAVGVVEIILIGCPDRACHYFQRAADRTGAEHSFKDRQTE